MGAQARFGERDAVVVGAGIVGLSVATELALRGQSVVVVEKDSPGFEGSTRNMGAIGPMGKHAADLANASVPLWHRLSEATDIGLRQGGRLYLAHTERQMGLLATMVATSRDSAYAIDSLDGDEVRSFMPLAPSDVIGGILCLADLQVDPVKAMDVVLQGTLDAGVHVMEGTAACSIEVDGDVARGIHLENGGRLSAETVVVAGGVWSARLLKTAGVRMPTKMVWAQLAETQPLPVSIPSYIRGPSYGFRQMPSGKVRFGMGGYESTATRHALGPDDLSDLQTWLPILVRHRKSVKLRIDPRFLNPFQRLGAGPKAMEPPFSDRRSVRALGRLQQAFPELSGARVDRTWGGFISMTPDGLPVIGSVPGIARLYVASGFNGQGFGLGPAVANAVVQAVNDETNGILHRYRINRFQEEEVSFPEHFI